MKVILTDLALRDLEDIRAFYEARSLQGRDSVFADIGEIIRSFEDGLVRGRPTPRDDVFERVTRKFGYLIPYHVRGSELFILRVYDSRQSGLDYSGLSTR